MLRRGAAQAMTVDSAKTVQSTLAKLSLCRTHHLGGRKFECRDCGETGSLYNSCGDRHCPECSGGKRVDFYEKASKLIINGVVYYQVVVTLPSELSKLALGNRYEMADLLVQSAWKSLRVSIRQEQGYQPAAITVLHTWNQKLEAHWHVHLLVPGEGPSLDGKTWKKATAPPEAPNSDGYYLVDADRLRERFRKKAIAKLERLSAQGKLNLGGGFQTLRCTENWEAFVKNLESKNWVAYIQPPPKGSGSADQVVKYLTRYLTGGPISNHRLQSVSFDEVTFLAREGRRRGGEREQVPVTLSLKEFTERWCLHIQPEQLTKTRYFGGWSTTQLSRYTRRCDELVGGRGSETDVIDPAAQDESPAEGIVLCSECGSDRMVQIRRTEKPSWDEVFGHGSESIPWWYQDLKAEDDRRFWDGCYGEGFNDWYLETFIEGAKAAEPEPAPPRQLDLPGFPLQRDALLESF